MKAKIKELVRIVLMLTGIGLANGAWATAPIAEWTDFRNLTSGDYTWTVDSSCTIDPNTGVLTIGESGGLYISTSGFGDDDYTLTIAIEAEIPTTFADDRTIVDILVNGNNRVSVAVNGTTMGQCWNAGSVSDTSYGKNTFPSGRNLFIIKYRGANGTTTCYNNNNYIGNSGDLKASSGKVWLLGVGCYNSANASSSISEVAEGMKIYSIRLYGSRITEAEVTADYNTYYPANSYLTLSGTDADWSTAAWDNSPSPKTACYVTVTENTSLNVDTAVSVNKVFFNVASGKTLTLTGSNAITATNGIYVNGGETAGGTISVPNEGLLSGEIKVQGDAGLTISGNSESAGTVSIDVAATKTLTLSAGSLTVADTINVTGGGTIVPSSTIAAKVHIASGATVNANSGNTIYVSNFDGAGTIVFDGVLPSKDAAESSAVTASATDSTNWTGTLYLKNYNTTETSTPLYPHYWCSSKSKLKFTRVAGYLPGISGTTKQLGYDGSELGEWILEDVIVDAVTKYAFTKTDGFSNYWIRFKKLSGSGTIADGSGKTQTPKIRIADGSEFTGTLKLDQGMRVAFSDSDVDIDAKQIVIASGEEVTASKAWTTDGFVVNGTLNLNAAPSGKVVGGSGTVNLGSLSVANGITDFASAAAWTGKVVVPAFTSSGEVAINCNNLGSQKSKIVFKGITRSSWDWIRFTPDGGTINPTVQLDGDIELTNGVDLPYITSFSKLIGTGSFALRRVWQGEKRTYKINTLESYSGTLTAERREDSGNLAEMSLSVGTLALEEGSTPSTSDRLVKINSDSLLSNIVDVDLTTITIGGEATEYKLVAKNLGTATAGLYLAPAVIKSSDGTLTPYESVDAAFTALSSLENDAYDYVAVYDSATVTFSDSTKSPKIKTVGDGVTLTLNSGYGDYGWAAGSPGEDGVVTYSFGPIPATYTWVGAEDASWFAMASWQCGGAPANRFIGTTDNAIFSSDASVTISGNYTVASITNSANVAFTASSAQTITVGEGGVVMTALGNSITLTNVTLSKVPTTTAATLAVQTTGGGDDPIVYTVVNAVASVDGVGYATMAEALAVEGEAVEITLQQNVTGDVVLRPGQTLIINGKTVSGEIVGNAPGVEVVDYNNMHMFYMCVDNTTNAWKGTNNGAWNSPAGWTKEIVPGSATAVTISSFATLEGTTTTGTIALPGDITVKSITLGEGVSLTLTAASSSTLTTTDGAIMLASGQSISVNENLTLSPAPSTSEDGKYVKITIVDATTTYTVADHKATVYDSEDAEVKKYDSVGDAFAAATDGQKITLFANSSDAITLSDKSIKFNEGSFTFSGSFTGNGTLIMTALPKSLATTLWSEGWTGTLWLKNVAFPAIESGANVGKSIVNPVVFGNANSTLRLTGCEGGFSDYYIYDDSKHKFPGTVDLVDGDTKPAFKVTSSWPGFGKTVFAKLTGTGTLTADTTAMSGHYYQILDASEFAGSITIPSATSKFRVGIGTVDATSDNGSSISDRTLTIQGGAEVTIASGKTWTAPGGITVDGSLTVPALSSLSGTIAGGGTITCQALHAFDYTPTFGTWTGTVVLPPELASINASGVNKIYFNSYGITGSTVKVGEIKAGWLQIETINPTVEVVTEFTLTAFSPQGRPYTFTALKGGGEFSVSCPADSVANYASWGSDHSAYYLVKDVSNFTGSITVSNCGIAIGDSKPAYNTPGGKIIINSGKSVTVAAGKTWTATNLKIDGEVSISNASAFSGTVEGNGRIVCTATLGSALTYGSWTGTVVLPYINGTDGGFYFNRYGKAGSTVEIANDFTGWLNTSSEDTRIAKANVVVNTGKTFTISGSNSSTAYGLTKLSGAGNFAFRQTNAPGSFTISTLEGFTGTISNSIGSGTPTAITITKVKLASAPTPGLRLVNTDTPNYVNVSGVYVGEVAQAVNLIKKSDGIYVAATSSVEGSGVDAVTTIATSPSDSQVEVSVNVGDDYTGTIIVPANVTKLATTGTAVADGKLKLKVNYGVDSTAIYENILTRDASGYISLTSDADAAVDDVKVTPEIKTGDAENPPMAMSGSAPAFSAKAIPGLWYAVKAASSETDLGDKFKYGTPVQATGNTVNIEAPTFPGTVTYYRLSAGMNQDDVTRYIVSTNRLAVRPTTDGLLTTDGLFAYGENSTTTTAAHDCYRIPAIASTWLPGDANPEKATLMGIYDARTSYWDLGQRMNKTTNERQWNDNAHHFSGIDIAGNYSLDGGASWSAAQIMIDVPNAFDPATGTDNRDSTNGISKDYDIGDPAIVYVPETKKFLMMGITGGGNSSVSNITANAMGADLVMYECTASSVANGAPVWQKVTGFTKEGVIALLKAKDDTLTFDYPPNGYSFDYDSTRAWTRETVYFLSILQGPGNALVTREDCGSIKTGTIVFPMQYCAKKRTTDGNHVGISYTFALYSTDNGATWNVTSVCKDEAAYGSECCIAQLDDGSLLMEVRPPNASTKRAFFRSTDFNTWAKACELVESAGPAEGSILRIGAKDGKSVYACSFTTGATRADLQLFIGTDYTSDEDVANVAKGINWTTTPFCTIWKGDTGTASTGSGVDTVVYGYSSLVMLDETTLGVLSEAHGHIYFTKVDVSSALR